MATYSLKKISDIFGKEIHRTAFIRAEENGKIPLANREAMGSIQKRTWSIEQLPMIGREFGFLKALSTKGAVLAFFNTKGGILKTTLAMSVARIAALHGYKVVVVGLDLQCDITSALGLTPPEEEDLSLEEADQTFQSFAGLHDVEQGRESLENVILQTDIPNLHIIPETSELHLLNINLTSKTNREQWLQKNVIEPLKKNHGYDLIILDCSPNWNNLVTNALTACDLLISPIECKINNYRNFPSFKKFIDTIKKDADLTFNHIFVTTRFSATRKLSREIRAWYLGNIPNCLPTAIKEGIKGEEAMAKNISIIEHAPTSLDAEEMRQLMMEIWNALEITMKEREKKNQLVIEQIL